MSDHEDGGRSTVVELKNEGTTIIKTTVSSKEINIDANCVEQRTGSADHLSGVIDAEKNPFTSSGKLSRKADYILSHSTITRSELRISDPDVPSRSKVEANASERLLNGDAASDPVVVDEQPIKAVSAAREEKEPPTGLVNGYTGTPVEAEVSQVLLQMPEKDKAEQVKLESRRKCCKCCIVQ